MRETKEKRNEEEMREGNWTLLQASPPVLQSIFIIWNVCKVTLFSVTSYFWESVKQKTFGYLCLVWFQLFPLIAQRHFLIYYVFVWGSQKLYIFCQSWILFFIFHWWCEAQATKSFVLPPEQSIKKAKYMQTFIGNWTRPLDNMPQLLKH
jgi:hypothetical protein